MDVRFQTLCVIVGDCVNEIYHLDLQFAFIPTLIYTQ